MPAPTNGSTQLGVDVGGTTIKGAIVDTATGQTTSPIQSRPTPEPATPKAIGEAIHAIADELDWNGTIGCALPGVVESRRLRRAVNLAPVWNEPTSLIDLRRLFDMDITVLNDADAVGLAEVRYVTPMVGGLAIVLTFGTGIGSALVHDGVLIENSELGELGGSHGTFEEAASGRAVTDAALDCDRWAEVAQPYFDQLETLLNPHLWIIGGGLSGSFDSYFGRIKLRSPIRKASLGEHSGLVGAAVAAYEAQTRKTP